MNIHICVEVSKPIDNNDSKNSDQSNPKNLNSSGKFI